MIISYRWYLVWCYKHTGKVLYWGWVMHICVGKLTSIGSWMAPSHYRNLCWNIVNLIFRIKFSLLIENVGCRMVPILSPPQFVNPLIITFRSSHLLEWYIHKCPCGMIIFKARQPSKRYINKSLTDLYAHSLVMCVCILCLSCSASCITSCWASCKACFCISMIAKLEIMQIMFV